MTRVKVAAPAATPAPGWVGGPRASGRPGASPGMGWGSRSRCQPQGGSGFPVPMPVPLLPRSPHGLGSARSRGPGDQGKTLRWRRKVEMFKC